MSLIPLQQLRTRAGYIARGVICRNRKAMESAKIKDGTLEVGLVLSTSEVKSLREGKCDLTNSTIAESQKKLVVSGMCIPRWSQASVLHDHDPTRERPILLTKYEKKRLLRDLQQDNLTVFPCVIYFNEEGLAKMSIAVTEKKEQIDKREMLKEKEYQRSLGLQ